MAKFPLVSIIIVNWNGGEVFKSCLKSLRNIYYPNLELIVVDNGSTDGSERLPEALNLTTNYHLLINKDNVGFATANNQGLNFATGKYILLLNNDTKVTPEFLNKMVNKMDSDSTLGVIQPKIYMMDREKYLDNAGSFLTRIGFLEHWGFGEKDGPDYGKEREIFSAKGACLLIRAEVIKKVGLFDDDFVSYFEESDFCYRVWLSGFRVLFYPDATIYHKVGFTIRRLDVSNINFHYYKNRVCSLIKNLEFKHLIVILPTHVAISIAIALIFVIRGGTMNSLLIIKALFWNLVNLPKTLRKRKQVQKLRKVSDDHLFKYLMHPVNFNGFYQDFRRVETDLSRKAISIRNS